MTIELKPEQEEIIDLAIQAGLFRSADEVLDAGLEAIRQQMEARKESSVPIGAEEWSREVHAWVNSHSTTTPLLSDEAVSRDSIYGIRGL